MISVVSVFPERGDTRGLRDRLEGRRVDDLRSFGILDSPREESYDDIVALARMVAGTRAAYITFLDARRLWFKSVEGLPANDLPRDRTFCQFVVDSGEYVLIEDTERDPRFLVCADGRVVRKDDRAASADSDGGAAPAEGRGAERLDAGDRDASARDDGDDGSEHRPIRFYLGVPLRSNAGSVLGTLCVADFEPRTVGPEVISALERLAGQVTALLELRRANAQLEAERETFSTLFEVAPVPLVLVSEGVIQRTNHVFAALVTDDDTDSLLGLPISRFLDLIPVRPGDAVETDLKNEAGGAVPVSVYRTHLKLHDKSFDLLALYDISDRREKEQVLKDQRLQAENAARIKDTFLSLVSHDLKSPLSGIYAMLDLLANAGSSFSEEDRDEAIRDLRSSVALLMEMISQLLNIHRLESGQLQVELTDAAIRPIARDVLLTLNRQLNDKKLTADVAIGPEFSLRIDEALFREALFNLVSNAVKFSPTGGTIRIEAEGSEVRVIDQGGGVPPEDVADLFRQEVKTSRPGTAGEGGTGLGLPLVRDIMRAHGGDVSIGYTGAQGSCFVLTVPGGGGGNAGDSCGESLVG